MALVPVPAVTGAAFSAKMKDQQIAEGTKSAYRSKNNVFKGWLIKNHPACVADDIILLPLDPSVVSEFLGCVGIGKHKESAESMSDEAVSAYDMQFAWRLSYSSEINSEKIAHPSLSSIGGFKSAILHLYRERDMKPSENLLLQLNIFFNGYKNEVAKLKLSGIFLVGYE